jgi:hypothetical protein
MSIELDIEEFIEDAPLAPPPPPPPPPPISVDEAMERVAAATAQHPIGEEMLLDSHDADVIRMRPRLNEMNALDALQSARPYVARAFVLVAILILLRLVWQLRQRYQIENLADTRARPMDRRSVMAARRKVE